MTGEMKKGQEEMKSELKASKEEGKISQMRTAYEEIKNDIITAA